MKIHPLSFGLSLLLGAASPAFGEVTIRKVVLGANQTGDLAPGTNGRFSTSFRAPSINREGAVVFSSEVAGGGKFGIWTADANSKIKLIAIEGGAAAGTTGKFTDLDFYPVIDEHGAVAFYGVTDLPPSKQGVWLTGPGGSKLQLAAFTEKPLGGEGTTPKSVDNHPLLVNGRIQFAASFVHFLGTYWIYDTQASLDSEVRSGIFSGTLKTLQRQFWEDTPLNVSGLKVAHNNVFLDSMFNAAGETALTFNGEDFDPNIDYGLAIVSPQGIPDARDTSNQEVGGAGGVVNLGSLLGFNEDSEVLLNGSVGPEGSLDQIPGLFAGALHDLKKVVLVGETAPGLAAPSFFKNPFYAKFASQKSVAFYGTAITPPVNVGDSQVSNQGIWLGSTDGVPQPVAIGGNQAPGMPEGVKFSQFALLQAQEGFFVNRQGVVAFVAGMEGLAGYDPFSRKGRALYAGKPGALEVIAHGGDPFEVAPGDIRTVDTISVVNSGFSGNSGIESGGRSALNEANEIAFRLTFTNATAGLFVAKLDLALPPNSPPRARDEAVTLRGSSIKIDVLANDSDADRDPLKITAVTPPGFGTAKISGKTITYQPGATFSGTDSFTYTIADGQGGSDIGTVTVYGTFGTLKGNYQQLVTAGPDEAHQSAVGFVKVTLSAKGGLTAKFTLHGVSYSVKGTVDDDGAFSKTIPRKNQDPLQIDLQFTPDDQGVPRLTAHIGGDLPHYYNVLDEAVAPTALPSGIVPGNYTVLLPPDANAANPRGIGWAKAKLTAKGVFTIAGRLADDTKFSGATVLDAANRAPLFISIYKKPKGELSGVLTFQSLAQSDFAGTLTWHKPTQTPAGAFFPGGFTATTAASGALYESEKNVPALVYGTPATPRAGVHLRGGGVSDADATGQVSLADKFTADLPNASAVKVSIDHSKGGLSGSFVPAPGAKAIKFTGVLHQGENRAAGFFRGATQSGTVTFEPQ